MNKKTGFLLVLLIGAGVLSSTLYAAPLNIVVSSKPFHSLVASVMAGRGTPVLLMDGDYSPHQYQLKPRDAYTLQQANLIFWGGGAIEPFMVRALNTVASQAIAFSLQQSEGLALLPARVLGEPEVEQEHHQEIEHEHHHDSIDPHFWLDPLNAIAMVHSIVHTLSQIDPDGSDLYRQNGSATTQRLKTLHQQLEEEMRTLQRSPFMVYHDSYQYFEHRYQLNALGSITQHAEFGASAKAIQQVRDQISRHQVRCVFKEPQFPSRLVQIAIEGSPARIGVLDPLGSNLIPGTELYFQLLSNIAHSLKSCL